ncbi:MAG: hypothetical protein AB1817_00155 [Chloroflexota bacterium]
MRDRQGCLAGLFELFLLNTVFDWLQRNFGFGKGCSCSGIGCGIIFFCIFLFFLCQIVTGTNWLKVW